MRPIPRQSESDLQDLRRLTQTMRRWIIEQSLASNVGHVGSAFSIVDLMAVLWGAIMVDAGSDRPDRDRFVLGKGHAALTLYCALRARGVIDESTFQSYCMDDSLLGVHPEAALPGVDVSTGSLGHSLSVGCGLALGLRTRGLGAHTYVLLSDAECNEGQIWEAAMFAAQHRLDNLTALVDLNGLQALGYTRGILDLDPLAERWRAFGWAACELDGHNHAEIWDALSKFPEPGRPRVLVARTVLGKGVSFMENRVEWHYRNLSEELAERALAEIEGRP